MNGRQFRAWWLGAGATALLAAGVWGFAFLFGPRSAGGAAHPAAPCTTCHERLNEDAALYAAGGGGGVPPGPVGGVTFGSLNHPESWSQAGKAERFWDLTWDRSTNGNGPLYTRWIPTEARPEGYYLSFAGFPRSV